MNMIAQKIFLSVMMLLIPSAIYATETKDEKRATRLLYVNMILMFLAALFWIWSAE